MSVFKRSGQTAYSYDFRVNGARYSGNTGETARRAAEQFEEQEKRKARRQSAKRGGPLTVGAAVSLYWEQVGQHLRNADTMLVNLAWLERELGKTRLLAGVGPGDVARLIAKRRSETSKVGKEPKPLSAATVNRSVIDPLRAVMTRAAKKQWHVPGTPIDWGDFRLKEPQERVRELSAEEEGRLFAVLRPDYHAIVRFALLTGCRREECVDLTWRAIDWQNRQFRVTGKGRKTRTIPLTDGVRDLLRPLPRAHERVFVFASARADFAERGSLHPMNAEGLKSIFARAVARAGIEDFHFHDLRHTCASRLLRTSRNLRLVKDLLGHEDIQTTLKYAHVTIEDLRNAMQETETATKNPTAVVDEGGKPMIDNG